MARWTLTRSHKNGDESGVVIETVRADLIVYTANTTCPKTRTLITKPKTINCIQNNTAKLAYVLLRLLAT